MAATSKDTSPLVHPYLPSLLLFANGNGITASTSVENSSSFSLELTEYSKINEVPVDRKAAQTLYSHSIQNAISCMEWNPNPQPFYHSIAKGGYNHDVWNENSPGLLAIGTQSGSVSLINWKNISSKDNIVVEECELCTNTNNNKDKDRERGPGPCSAVSWNKLKYTQLAAGFENSKSDNCVLVWDIEHSPLSQIHGSIADVSLRLCSGESASSVSWLAENPFLLAVGTSMGLVRIFDVRSRTVAAKIAPPPSPIAPHQILTAVDASQTVQPLVRNPSLPPLQPVLSLLTHTGQRPRKVRRIVPDPNRPAVFATFSDVAGDAVKVWDLVSLTGPGYNSTLTGTATAPSAGASPSFTIQPKPVNSSVLVSVLDAAWVCSRSGLLALALNGQKGIFLYTAPLPATGVAPASSSSSVASSQVPLLVLPTTSIVRSVSSLGNDMRTYLNSRDPLSGPIEEAPWLLDSLFVTTMSPPLLAPGSNRLSASARPSQPTSSPWQLQCMRVRERVPLAFSLNISGFLAVALSGRRGVGFEERVAFRTSEIQESELTHCIQRRAHLGYSLDASENLEILADELNRIFALVRQQMEGGKKFSEEFLHYSERLISTHRVWVWVDRVKSDSKHNISFRKCGVLDILLQEESSNRTSVLGKQMYVSKDRSQCRVFCGWLPQTTTSMEEEDSLLSIVEDHEEQNSFERAAAIAIWHGNLPLAVRMLQSAVDKHQNVDSNKNANTRGDDDCAHHDHEANESDPEKDLAEPVEWDAIVNDAYIQVVNLVVVCLAGYTFTPAVSSSAQTPPPSISSSWVAMNRLLITKIQQFLPYRRSAAYLAASLLFLSSGEEQSQPTTTSSAAYREILDSEGILLEDRIAFAVSYLSINACTRWLEQRRTLCLSSSQLDGLLLTGFGKDGMEILQQHLDLYGDIQVVSLLASRLIDAASFEPGANLPSTSSTSLAAMPPKPTREWIWLHEYRQLLNRAELFVERATLDVALNKRCQIKKALTSSLSLGSNTSTVFSAGRGRFASSGVSDASKSNAGGKHKRSAYTLPPQANVAHIFLRCHYCAATLPVDALLNRLDKNRLDQLMKQKTNISSCGACAKQLPKCYVCQLNLGMVNPYLERLAVHNRINSSSSKSDVDTGLSREKQSGRDFTPKKLVPGWDRDPSQPTAASSSSTSHHHNTVGMNRWLFFCQSCKHGGHMDCIEDWFTDRTLTLPSGESQVLSRRRCGVNGCSCVCKAR